MIQSSCSELLVDTAIHDPVEAFAKFTTLMEKVGWESSPPLSLELLQQLKDKEEVDICIFDAHGNRAWLEYGDNGYIETGYRLDTRCNHCDGYAFPLFKVAIEKLQGELIACDGGSTHVYEEWSAEQ